jgi:hypothetical protein
MAGVQTLAAELYSPRRERRELAIDCIVDVAIETGEFDGARELLQSRWSGPELEPDGELWQQLFSAIREVTLARGRKRGFRPIVVRDELPHAHQQLAGAAVDLMFDAISLHDGHDVLDHDLRYATGEQRAIYAIWRTHSEVHNGGFSQFFMNSTGILWPYFVAGVATIGAQKTASLIEIVRRAFPSGVVPRDRATLDTALELVDYDALSRADNAFYALLDVELWPAVGGFIRSRLSEFFELSRR